MKRLALVLATLPLVASAKMVVDQYHRSGEKLLQQGDTLVFMGDSITKFGNESVDGYLNLVWMGLSANGIKVRYHGAGVSGETAAQMRKRFERDVIARKPQVVTIYAGVNDCGYGWPKKPGSAPDDVAAMTDLALAAGIRPVLLSPTSVKGEAEREDIRDYAAAVKAIAADRKIPYAATYEAFRAYADDPRNPAVDAYGHKLTKDGTHLGAVGYRLVARETLKAFGLSAVELERAEAAWRECHPFFEVHPCVKVADEEYARVQAAAAREGVPLAVFHRRLLERGIAQLSQSPVLVKPTTGATKTMSVTTRLSFGGLDELLASSRTLAKPASLPRLVESALLVAVQDLPPLAAVSSQPNPAESGDISKAVTRRTFTVSGYDGAPLHDFPVLVRLNDAPAPGLVFTDAAGRRLPYEVEQGASADETLVWVRLPEFKQGARLTMSVTDAPLAAGDPHDVWSGGYVGVWHFGESAGGVAMDAVQGLDAVPDAVAALKQKADAGVFGLGRVLSTDLRAYQGQSLLKIDDVTPLDAGSSFTVSGWVKLTGKGSQKYVSRLFSRNRGGGYGPDWELALIGDRTLALSVASNTPLTAELPHPATDWIHVAAVFDGPRVTGYVNGEQVLEATIPPVQDTDNKLVFGAKDRTVVSDHLVGLIDEFRIRKGATSSDWIKAEYAQRAGVL